MIAGENLISRITLYESDGVTPILLSSLALLFIKVRSRNKEFGPYIYGANDEIRVGATNYEIEFEITKSISRQFGLGTIQLQITIERTNAEFEVDGVQREIFYEDVAEVNNETTSDIELSLSIDSTRNTNIDGGSFSDVYLADQNIDGGSL